MIQAKQPMRIRLRAALAMAALGALIAGPARAATVNEPATVFYGKIVGTGSARPFLVTEGTLEWTIRRADGMDLTLQSKLFPLHGGEFSYRLDVPHEALASGLAGSAAAIPIGATAQTEAHLRILVDGMPARILGPNGTTFPASQALRTATYRLDLAVSLLAPDSDGDGLPDWWEEMFGQEDGQTDSDQDGWNNLAEFRNGAIPNHDDRVPTLATEAIRVYADGTTSVRLRALDSDSAPSDLIYTVGNVPPAGSLYLRNAVPNAVQPDLLLTAGASFSQADVDAGRVVFADPNAPEDHPESNFILTLTLHDETPAHGQTTNAVVVNVYKPAPGTSLSAAVPSGGGRAAAWPRLAGVAEEEEAWMLSYGLSRDQGYIVLDASNQAGQEDLRAPSAGLAAAEYEGQYLPQFGPDKPHVLLGGAGGDQLAGSMESDVLVGGRGSDVLRGNGGADLFVIAGPEDGNDTIEDFNLAEHDAIDLTRVLNGSSIRLADYVQLTRAGGDSFLRVNFKGTGAGYNDMVLTLAGTQLASLDLSDLQTGGYLITGDKEPAPRVTIAATAPIASENGPVAGAVTLTRTGSLAAGLTVNLQASGSAANGVDYHFIASQASFPAGAATLVLQVSPYVDAVTELSEVAEIALLPGGNYEVGTDSVAQVIIEDLLPLVTIETLEPMAVKSSLQPAYLLITRSGVIDRSILVRLTIGGTAANSVDYESIPSFLNFAAGQTSLVLPVVPKATATLANGSESVSVAIRSDGSYRTGSPSAAGVVLVETLMTFVNWKQTAFPGVAENASSFAQEDYGDKGVPNLLRYAYQLDPYEPDLSGAAYPRFEIRDDRFTVAFRRPAAIGDLEYVVEVSQDMKTWHSGEAYLEPFYPVEHAGDLNVSCFRTLTRVSDTPQYFMRVRVLYAPQP
jgi:Cadherin-like/Calx-beta domain